MPRQPRLDLAGVSQHVVQRGNDRQPCFFLEADYHRYLDELHVACHRYIELNPVRAAMVAGPADYPWSSHRANTLDIDDVRLTTHPVVLGLGVLSEQRRAAYLALFGEVLDAQHVLELRLYLQQQRAFGSDRFRAAIEAQLGRCAQVRPAHRPVKKKAL